MYGPVTGGAEDGDTFVIQTTPDPDAAAPQWADHQEDIAGVATDVPPPLQGKSRTYFILSGTMGLRIRNNTTAASAAGRAWTASKVMRTD